MSKVYKQRPAYVLGSHTVEARVPRFWNSPLLLAYVNEAARAFPDLSGPDQMAVAAYVWHHRCQKYSWLFADHTIPRPAGGIRAIDPATLHIKPETLAKYKSLLYGTM